MQNLNRERESFCYSKTIWMYQIVLDIQLLRNLAAIWKQIFFLSSTGNKMAFKSIHQRFLFISDNSIWSGQSWTFDLSKTSRPRSITFCRRSYSWKIFFNCSWSHRIRMERSRSHYMWFDGKIVMHNLKIVYFLLI